MHSVTNCVFSQTSASPAATSALHFELAGQHMLSSIYTEILDTCKIHFPHAEHYRVTYTQRSVQICYASVLSLCSLETHDISKSTFFTPVPHALDENNPGNNGCFYFI